MPSAEPGISTVVILLAAATGLRFLLLLTAIGTRGRLARLERLLAPKRDEILRVPTSSGASPVTPQAASQAPSQPEIEVTSGGVFETFLNEDPVRKNLSKKEQAAAYRKWRQERGMNWSNS